MNNCEIILAGFGGQGILFMGKIFAFAAMLKEKQFSWLPSYGPEMRGGTANCHVIIDDKPVGSPIVTAPDVLVVMNRPSLDKFEDSVKKGGYIFVDRSLVEKDACRKDVKTVYVRATEMADSIGNRNLANMIMLGAVLKLAGVFSLDEIEETMKKSLPPQKQALVESNMAAVKKGYETV